MQAEVQTLNHQNDPVREEQSEEIQLLREELLLANEEIRRLQAAALLQEAFTSELIAKYEKMETEFGCAQIAAQIAQRKRVGVAQIA